MADYTDEQLKMLRRMVGDETEPYFWTNEELAAYLDAAGGDFPKTAGSMWREKAAHYSKQVDITEAGSSRKNSSLFDNAMKMVARFEDDTEVPVPEPTVIASTTRRIVRR